MENHEDKKQQQIKMMYKESNKWNKKEKPFNVSVFIMRKWKVDTLKVVINFPPSNMHKKKLLTVFVTVVQTTRPIE